MENVEIIPSTELTGLESTIVNVEALTVQVDQLAVRAREMKVETKNEYAEIGQILTDVRILRKQGEANYSGYKSIIDRAKAFIQTKLQKHTNACEIVEAAIRPKMKAFEQKEMAEAEAEEKQVNKERAKRGEAPATVQPALPTVAGYRRTTNYRIIVEDIPKFMRRAKTDKDLKRFITVDREALGKAAREMKDAEAFMKKYPGVVCIKD